MSETIKGLHRSHRCTEVSNKNIGEEVTVMGWVQKRRNLGSLIFIDLRDRSGLVQLVFDENDGAVFEKAGLLRSEFVIAATGSVRKRDGAINENLKTGDIEITVDELRILSESDTIIEPRTLQRRFKSILKRVGVPSVNYHCLRHIFATNCLQLGFDVKTLSEILGHASVETTLNMYVHTSMERKRLCMSMLVPETEKVQSPSKISSYKL